MPTRRRNNCSTAGGTIFKSTPSTSTVPVVGCSAPNKRESNNDFPAPLRPVRQRNSPGSTLKETPSKTLVFPYVFAIFLRMIMKKLYAKIAGTHGFSLHFFLFHDEIHFSASIAACFHAYDAHIVPGLLQSPPEFIKIRSSENLQYALAAWLQNILRQGSSSLVQFDGSPLIHIFYTAR